MKDEHNMTPLNYHFFNNSYWYARYILLHEFQNYSQNTIVICSTKALFIRKKVVEDDHKRMSILLFFF